MCLLPEQKAAVAGQAEEKDTGMKAKHKWLAVL